MNIQDLGSIGELIAAAATIATLIYLARQVRANTKATQTASRIEITRDYRDMNNALYDSDVLLAWETGLREYPNMSFKERSYFGNHFANQALCFQDVDAH